ncbi:hypothetical protein GUJ93_ZPchr0002g23861 [Zizania palustris]|uniref:Pentatricopeptide repeat-containing protein n=1 Tax=Zizania palustris TaxID=103762 RepID=A0A8J5RTW0_ZIZPA|nr:hypothetical protein GUJ93_ZPchr0002g23861 [Zizania palustris]
MYAEAGDTGAARAVFDGMPRRDAVTWNAAFIMEEEEITSVQGQGKMPKKGTKSTKGMDDEPQQQQNKLPDHLELQRTRVICKADAPTHLN